MTGTEPTGGPRDDALDHDIEKDAGFSGATLSSASSDHHSSVATKGNDEGVDGGDFRNHKPAMGAGASDNNESSNSAGEADTLQTVQEEDGHHMAVSTVKSEEEAVAPEAQRTKFQTTVIVLALCSGTFLAALDITIISTAIPTIADEFQSPLGYTWIGSAYLLANAATVPSWGKISDIWGRKPVMLAAVAIFWIGSLICALSTNVGMLIAARAIQGIGGMCRKFCFKCAVIIIIIIFGGFRWQGSM